MVIIAFYWKSNWRKVAEQEYRHALQQWDELYASYPSGHWPRKWAAGNRRAQAEDYYAMARRTVNTRLA